MKQPFTGFRPRRLGQLIPILVLFALLGLFLSGCDTDTPQNTFDTKGEVAEKQAEIFYLSMWPAIAIMILVLGGLLVIMLRFRERDPEHIPRKHTINVAPGGKVSYLVTADAEGRWAYHCHLLFHMLGMFREVRVSRGRGS